MDGWLYSGDAGYITEGGQLVCIDRIKDLMQLTSGARFSPMFIENKLKFCPYIVETCVLGHERGYVTTMICIDYKHTGKWAEEHRVGYTTYTDLASKNEIYDLIEKEVVRVNRSLPEAARIQKFLLLYKEFDPGRRRTDPHPQAAAQFHRRAVRERDRSALPGYGPGPRGERDPVPGRQDHDHRDRFAYPQDEAHGSVRPGERTQVVAVLEAGALTDSKESRPGPPAREKRPAADQTSCRSCYKPMEVISDLFNAATNPQLWVIGIVVGSLYALVAMGFALIYKSTSIINFAQGEFVLVGGYVCLVALRSWASHSCWRLVLTMPHRGDHGRGAGEAGFAAHDRRAHHQRDHDYHCPGHR